MRALLLSKFGKGNDYKRLMELVDAGRIKVLPGYHDVYYRHDDWCLRLKETGPCCCAPTVNDIQWDDPVTPSRIPLT